MEQQVASWLGSNRCPGREALEAFNAGILAPAALGAVATHLELCPRCLDALQRLDDATDPLLSRLAEPATPPPYTDAECHHVLERLAVLGATPVGFDDTLARSAGLADDPLLRVGPYEILEPLGRGGMGAVYKARHVHLGKVVALKLLHTGWPRSNVAAVCLLQEMKAVGRLNHPNIVQATDAAVEGIPYLAMEFLAGADLGKVSRANGPLRVADACECARQAAVGLQHAHEHGLVHRDVKPSNLMLTPGGTVKLLDLGLARLHEGPAADVASAVIARPARAPHPITLMGTSDYMAPEQIRDCHGVDIRADLYSLGCTLYHLLAGQSPFGQPGRGPEELRLAHLRGPVPPITLPRPDVPEALGAIIDRLLAKRPEDRFATPAEVADALLPYCAGANLPRLLPRVESDPVRPAPVFRPHLPRLTGPDGRPSRMVLATFTLILLTVAAAVWIVPDLRRRAAAPATPDPVRVEALQLTHIRNSDGGDFLLGELGQACPAAGVNVDAVRVLGRLSRPAYCYLIAFRPDGKEELCWPLRPDQAPAAADTLTYPPLAPYRLRGPAVGPQAFVLVASSEPLPSYPSWKAEHGEPVWRPDEVAAIWRFNGSFQAQRPLAGPDEKQAVPPNFEQLCRFFQSRRGVAAVAAVIFPVRPDPPPVAAPPQP